MVGGICAAIAGVIIGVPVLRLKGDYLAIVTLAFGEIIKNIVNVLYIGLDSAGLHFGLLQQGFTLEEGGEMIINGPMGVSGCFAHLDLYLGLCARADHAVPGAQPDQQPFGPRHHGGARPTRSRRIRSAFRPQATS